MATNSTQKLIVMTVDPHQTNDLTPVLQKFPWWGEGWNIQHVSLSPYGDGNSHVAVALVLNQERQGDRHTLPPSLG